MMPAFTITQGYLDELVNGNTSAITFRATALAKLKSVFPSMIVAEPGCECSRYEDGGRTLIVPCSKNSPRLYGCYREGVVVLMLASEY